MNIVLSPGHGGSDPGAVDNGLREKDLTLAVSIHTREHLLQNFPENNIYLLRNSDITLSLPARRDMVLRLPKIDLYVAIHFNAFNVETAKGFETFTHSGELYASTLLSQKILHDEIWNYMQSLGSMNRGAKRFNHYETRVMPCPTVIVEYLFITNRSEAEHAKDATKLKNMGIYTALGIAKALDLKRVPIPIPDPVPDPKPEPSKNWIALMEENKDIFVELGKRIERS